MPEEIVVEAYFARYCTLPEDTETLRLLREVYWEKVFAKAVKASKGMLVGGQDLRVRVLAKWDCQCPEEAKKTHAKD